MKSTRIGSILALVVVVAGSAACGGGITTATEAIAPICAVESLSCFRFKGALTVSGRTMEVEGWSQDMPLPGYANRWRYVVADPSGELARYGNPTRTWLGGAAVVWPGGVGGMFQEALASEGGRLFWRLDMRPTDPAVAAQFAALAGAQEYRAQIFEVRAKGGESEILITELN
jgi:hypothetical protein